MGCALTLGGYLGLQCAPVFFFVSFKVRTQFCFSSNLPAQRKAKAVRAAENKQKARKAVYGYRTSDDVERDPDTVLGLIYRH